nr:integrase, catalytic region, zinc finger, CCHC-type, peptidase aspartic, catalytic [Tanacetum cinerariifolium]
MMANLLKISNVPVPIPDHPCLIGMTLPYGNNAFDYTVGEKRMRLTYLSQLMRDHSRWECLGKYLLKEKKGRQNRGQGNNAWGASAVDYGGAQNRVGNANLGQARQIKCYNCNDIGHIARNRTQPKRLQNSEYFKDEMLLMQAQEHRVALDEKQLLFITGGQDITVDEDVDEQPVQDLTLNVDNVFQADDYDAFDSDVDEALTAQTMFMENLSSSDLVYDEAGPSYDSDILSEVHDHDHYQDVVCEHHEVHEMHDDVQPNYVVDSHADYTSESNMILYDQCVKDNAVPVVQIDTSLAVELATYKEQVKLYERRAKFELIEREEKIDEQLRIVITDRNVKGITPTGLTEGERGFEQTKECYLIEVILFFKTLKEHFEGIHKALTKEIKEIKEIFKEFEAKVDQNVVHRKHDEIEWKNLWSLLEPVRSFIARVTSSNAPTFDLVFVIGQLKDQVQSRGNTIRELREKIFRLKKKHSETVPIHDRKALDSQTKDLHAKINALHDLNECWWEENEKVKRHYKKLYDSIKITRAKYIKTSNSLLTKVANLKAQIKENHKYNCVTMPAVKSKVLAPDRYAIDIEPIPPRIRNNREVHLDYLNHLKESVGTLREIELLEYVIGTCLKDFNQREKKHAVTPVSRKKQVTFMDPCETSTNNTLTHVKQHTMHQNNEPVIPFTRVKSATTASESKPRSNTKKDRTLPAKSDMQKVEVHPRNNKSSVKQKNHVDSNISYCSKHMTWDRSRLKNFVKKFIGAVRFGNDHFGAIMGYGDYVIGDSVISRVYYVEGLGHNLFSVKQFYDSDLEVTFKKHSCYVRDTDGVELIKGLVPDPVPATPYIPPANKDLEILFQPMFDEYLEPPRVERPMSPPPAVPVPINTVGTPSSTTIDQDAPCLSHSPSSLAFQSSS